MKKLIKKLFSPFSDCRKYGISLWQCPSFLFVIMGIIIISAILIAYFIANLKIHDPKVVNLIVIGVATVLLIIDYIITQSFEKISEANRLKTEFINIISHQLRAPLTNLKFSFEVLVTQKMSNVTKDQQDYFDIIQENIKRMGEMVNNLLVVSRIETGRLPLKEEEFSLEELIKKVMLKFKSRASESKIKLIFEGAPENSRIKGDQFWVEQVIQNLLDNAINYTPENGEVKVKVYPFKKQHRLICTQVKDTGIGIPREEQKYIFQKFFRSRNVLKQQTDGSGLGLYIVKKVIELMGGKIWFESQEGKGTTFFFVLPKATPQEKVNNHASEKNKNNV